MSDSARGVGGKACHSPRDAGRDEWEASRTRRGANRDDLAEREAEKADREAARRARTVTRRAIRRLDLLEWVIFGVGAALAAVGGAIVAWIMSTMGDWDFRSTWIGASLFLFVVSGVIAVVEIRRDARADARRAAGQRKRDDG